MTRLASAVVTPSIVEARLLRIYAALNESKLPAASRAAISDVTHAAFTPSCREPEYTSNALNPGGLNIEVSFSEIAPRALRFDAAPGMGISAAEQQHTVSRLAALAEEVLAPWRPVLATERFGGFVSVVADGAHAPKYKAYLELRDHSAVLEQHVPDASIPGIRPHFVALGDGRPRLYLECTDGLALSDLVEWASRRGLAAEMLAAVEMVRRLTGSTPLLPPGVLCAVGTRAGGACEFKIELPSTVLTTNCIDTVTAILIERPRSEQAFQRWRAALDQDIVPTVVSVRVSAGLASPLLNVYTELAV